MPDVQGANKVVTDPANLDRFSDTHTRSKPKLSRQWVWRSKALRPTYPECPSADALAKREELSCESHRGACCGRPAGACRHAVSLLGTAAFVERQPSGGHCCIARRAAVVDREVSSPATGRSPALRADWPRKQPKMWDLRDGRRCTQVPCSHRPRPDLSDGGSTPYLRGYAGPMTRSEAEQQAQRLQAEHPDRTAYRFLRAARATATGRWRRFDCPNNSGGVRLRRRLTPAPGRHRRTTHEPERSGGRRVFPAVSDSQKS
jgi:hypothetical protein